MKIHTQGARFHGGQIDRIDDGFRALGHEVTPHISEADIIFINNPWFDQIIADKVAGRLKPGAKLIFNVQDVPHHIASYPIDKLLAQLAEADAVTFISQTTSRDVCELVRPNALMAPTGVIYQPIKPVTCTRKRKHPYKVMFVGRVGDPNKRAVIAAQALHLLGYTADQVVTVGGEAPLYGGTYWGVADDATLNDLYNSVDFVVATGLNEGMGLPALEAMAAGAIPLILSDLSTREEFFPASVFPEYAAVQPNVQSLARFIANLTNEDGGTRMEEFRSRLHTHYIHHWAQKLSPVGVARAILNVYDSIT